MGTLTVAYNGSNIVNGVSQSAPPDITYNGSTIVTALDGTKTLNTKDKMMKTNVVVGTKTLNTKDKMMKTNVTCTYARAWTQSTLTPSGSTPFIPESDTDTYAVGGVGNYAIYKISGGVVKYMNASGTIATAGNAGNLLNNRTRGALYNGFCAFQTSGGVDTYNESMTFTRVTASQISSNAVFHETTNGIIVINYSTSTSAKAQYATINASKTVSAVTTASSQTYRTKDAQCTAGDKVIIAGGRTSADVATAYMVNWSLTQTTVTSLGSARDFARSGSYHALQDKHASSGAYGFILGGANGSTNYSNAYRYNSSGSQTSATALPVVSSGSYAGILSGLAVVTNLGSTASDIKRVITYNDAGTMTSRTSIEVTTPYAPPIKMWAYIKKDRLYNMAKDNALHVCSYL